MFHSRRKRVFVVLFALGGLVAATAANTSDSGLPPGVHLSSDSEMEAEDAEGYVEEYGVTLQVAKDRLSYQESIGAAISDLRNNESDTFGGAWVEHSPLWQVVVRTTRSGPTAELISGYFSDIPIGVTVLRDAPWSEAQTLANMRAISSALDPVVDKFVLARDPRRPEGVVVTLRIPAHLSDATPAELAALVPATVTDKAAAVAWHVGPVVEKHDVYGGARLENSANILKCTTAFAVESGSEDGLLTGGHCPNSGLIYEAPNGTQHEADFEDDYEGALGDFQWFTTSQSPDNRIYTSNNTLRPITSYVDDADDLYVGRRVCVYGRRTGRHCSDIGALDLTDDEGVGSGVAMDRADTSSGDSGGPWYYGSKAYGVTRGTVMIDDEGPFDFWTPVAHIEDALDVTIMTG